MSKLDRLRNAITPGNRDTVSISGGPGSPAVDPEATTAPSMPTQGVAPAGPDSRVLGEDSALRAGAVPPGGSGARVHDAPAGAPFHPAAAPSHDAPAPSADAPAAGKPDHAPEGARFHDAPTWGGAPSAPGTPDGARVHDAPISDAEPSASGTPEGARFHDAPASGTAPSAAAATGKPEHAPEGARFHDAPVSGADHRSGHAPEGARGHDGPGRDTSELGPDGTGFHDGLGAAGITTGSGTPEAGAPPKSTMDKDTRPGMGAASPMDTTATTRLTRVAPDDTTPGDDTAPFLEADQIDRLNARWKELQGAFVDNPHDAVTRADLLLAETVEQLTARWSERQQHLQGRWSRGTDSDTENLRQALRDYRTFFQKLLSVAG